MKFFHLSDLHLGKRVNEFSMLEEQEHILNEIVGLADIERPSAAVIAGDVFDKPVPPVEAVKLLDDFLFELKKRGIKTLIIAGNHDSAERLAFGARFFGEGGVFIAPAYTGEVSPVALDDEFGRVNFYLLPFVKPAVVARALGEGGESYTAAVRAALSAMGADMSERNVLVTHQFVTGAVRCESEELSVGGADNVDASVFAGFDYVALGHIHGPQNIGDAVRYCGTPLKYSFSEAAHKKSVTIVEMGAKGDVRVRVAPLTPRRDFVALRGTYAQVTELSFTQKHSREDYYKITLTDEEDIPEGAAKLRYFYPNLMVLEYDNARTRAEISAGGADDVSSKTPLQLFCELYKKQNGRPMTDEMHDRVSRLIERIWEDGK